MDISTENPSSQDRSCGAVYTGRDYELVGSPARDPLKLNRNGGIMGTYKRNGNYYIDYRTGSERIREMIGPNKTLALKVLNKRKTAVVEGKHLDIRRDQQIKFADFAKIYFETHCRANNKSWMTADRAYLSPSNPNGLVAHFGPRYLYEITPLMIEEYKRKRKETVSAATVNRALQILSSLFNRALGEGLLRENPMKKVRQYRLDNKRLRYLEKGEIQKLLEHCSPKLWAVVTVAILTGMRKGEIQNLRWQDIDFERNHICILEQKNGDKSYMPISEPVRFALMKIRRHPKSPFVFCKDDGQPYNVRKSFETALRLSGITDASFHTLRHTCASHLIMSGVDLNTVRELMRHKSLSMTLRYAHLSRDHKSRAVEVLAGQMDTIWTLGSQERNATESATLVTQPESAS